jgi:hypothetical protein
MNTTNVPAVADSFKVEAHQNTTSPQSYCCRIQKLLRNISYYFTTFPDWLWDKHILPIMGDGEYFRGEKTSCNEAGYSNPCSAAAKNEKLWLATDRFTISFTCQHLILCLLPEEYFTFGALGAHCVYLYII